MPVDFSIALRTNVGWASSLTKCFLFTRVRVGKIEGPGIRGAIKAPLTIEVFRSGWKPNPR